MLERLRSLFESRGAASSPWGKIDGWMDGFRVEKVVKEAFARKGASIGMGSAELLRECMRHVAFGSDEVRRVRAQAGDQVAGMLAGMLGRNDRRIDS